MKLLEDIDNCKDKFLLMVDWRIQLVSSICGMSCRSDQNR